MGFFSMDLFSRFGRDILVAVILFAVTGVGIRIFSGKNDATDKGMVEQSGPRPSAENASSPRSAANSAPQSVNVVRNIAPMAPVVATPPPKAATPEEQTAAIRDAVVRDAVKTIRVAALRGDDATVRGLVPALRNQKATSRKVLDDALLQEENARVRTVLEDVLRQLN